MGGGYETRIRGYLRSEITRHKNKVDAQLSTLSIEEKSKILARLDKIAVELPPLNEAILKGLMEGECTEHDIEEAYNLTVDYEEKNFQLRS